MNTTDLYPDVLHFLDALKNSPPPNVFYTCGMKHKLTHSEENTMCTAHCAH